QRCFSSGAGDAAAPTERTGRSAPPTVRRLEQGLAAGVAVPTARTRWVHAAGCIGPGTASVPLRLPPGEEVPATRGLHRWYVQEHTRCEPGPQSRGSGRLPPPRWPGSHYRGVHRASRLTRLVLSPAGI